MTEQGWPQLDGPVDPDTDTYLLTTIYPCKQTCHQTENPCGIATKSVSSDPIPLMLLIPRSLSAGPKCIHLWFVCHRDKLTLQSSNDVFRSQTPTVNYVGGRSSKWQVHPLLTKTNGKQLIASVMNPIDRKHARRSEGFPQLGRF